MKRKYVVCVAIAVTTTLAGLALSAQPRDEQGEALFTAAQQGDIDKIKALLAEGVDVNKSNPAGVTTLHVAVGAGQQEVCAFLLEKGADINAKAYNSQTPLHWAAIAGRKDVVELLIAKGADANAKNVRGHMALDFAIKAGHKEITEVLLDALSGEDLASTLLSAVQSGNKELAAQVLDRGADVNTQASFGLTPLHLAVEAGRKEIVTMLLERNADVDIKDSAGRTVMHYAAEVTYMPNDPQGWTVAMTKLLVDWGADIDAKDNIGFTPLHYAARKYKHHLIEALVELGARIDIVDNRGRTPYEVMVATVEYLEAYMGHSLTRDLRNELKKASSLLLKKDCVYVVAPYGRDINPGTKESPLETIAAAIKLANPGDTIVVRGGDYVLLDALHLDKSGEPGNPIRLVAHSGEVPVLDFSRTQSGSLYVSGAYWHIKGISIIHTMSPVQIHGGRAHHNVFEQVNAFDNDMAGICINADGPSYNIILNCDAYRNFNVVSNGEGGDGFIVSWFVGPGNVLIGNRAWNNADDGFDLWNSNEAVRLEKCYSWRNGENIFDHPLFVGNGNGFKRGPGKGTHIFIKCCTWGHKWRFARGFTLNGSVSRGVILRNCTAWDNRTDYHFTWISEGTEKHESCIFVNNASVGRAAKVNIAKEAESRCNSWDATVGITLSKDDFLSLDDSKMSAPRNPDGSIPYNDFLRLAPDSAAIDAGTDVNMPYVGKAPDLGAFEYDPNENAENYVKMLHQYVRDHDLDKINELLDAGTDINDKDWLGYTPLHWAVYFGYADLIELLVSKGANPDIQSDTGRYALEIARAMAYPKLEALLRKLGATASDVTPD